MADKEPQRSDRWRIKLFGEMEVTKPNGERICLKGRKAGELLAYLALNPGISHSRHKLSTQLWGDTDVGHTRTRLRQEIAILRRLFEVDVSTPPLFKISGTELTMQSGLDVDAVHFLELCIKAKNGLAIDMRARLLSEAVGLYQSDLLNEFDSVWISIERIRFSQFFEHALIELSDLRKQQGNFTDAEQVLDRLLAHNPLNEDGYIALMRLYAEQGRPTRVHQQFQSLERRLRDSGLAPTEAARSLAATLREHAGDRAGHTHHPTIANGIEILQSNMNGQPPPPDFNLIAAGRPFDGEEISAKGLARPMPLSRRLAWLITAVLLLAVCFGVTRIWRSSRSLSAAPASVPPVAAFQPVWTYFYEPRIGEKANSEGTAMAYGWTPTDGYSVFVSGLIQTDHDNTDMIIVKLPLDHIDAAKADRYSSPEHDCDRAQSMCLDDRRSIYVLGETYVPEGHGDSEGWYLTLIHYDLNLKRLWVRRSPIQVKNENQVMQVINDGKGGCYVGGTGFVNGKKSILAMRYNSTGRILWKALLPQESEAKFNRLVTTQDGNLVVCGTETKASKNGNVKDDGLVIWLDRQTGKLLRHESFAGLTAGGSEISNVTLDRGGNIFVSGVFDTGPTSTGGKGRQIGLVKYRPAGGRLWFQPVKDTGPNVTQNGLGCNFQGDIAIGGTEHHSNGTDGIVLAWYDSIGNQTRSWRYPLPTGYKTAGLKIVTLGSDGVIQFFGEASKVGMDNESSLLIATVNLDGKLVTQSLFAPSPGIPNFPRDQCGGGVGLLVTGQAGVAPGTAGLTVQKRSLMVNMYK